MNPDYTSLYHELGLQPGCSLDDFRQAYRRHVASMHPDRSRANAYGSVLPLSDLTVLYDQAMRFHRRYGRLPGTAPAAGSPTQVATPAPAIGSDGTRAGIQGDDALFARTTGRWPWLFVAALVLLVVGIWQAPLPRTVARHVHAFPQAPSARPEPTPANLALGMDANTVLAIQGEPVHQRDDEWSYGPSWVRFEKGRVVDWYSSPLYRLKTTTPSPQPAD